MCEFDAVALRDEDVALGDEDVVVLSVHLVADETAAMCEGSACDLPVMDMVWREELSWLGIVLEGAASSDVIVTCMAAGRSAVTNDVKYMIAMVAAAIDVFML